ncbi:hypothetical protein [Anaerovibrio lipolyticus]|uniref:hypothetical protein n=1 Tax=Anaerovibrio lipolyticus TaxID=82374 RepID=UPI001356685C|nr:hypothetical protein [Anaerovibrio lipolyticus]
MKLKDDAKNINYEKLQHIIDLRKKVMLAEQERLRGDKTLSIAEAKERLLRRLK